MSRPSVCGLRTPSLKSRDEKAHERATIESTPWCWYIEFRHPFRPLVGRWNCWTNLNNKSRTITVLYFFSTKQTLCHINRTWKPMEVTGSWVSDWRSPGSRIENRASDSRNRIHSTLGNTFDCWSLLTGWRCRDYEPFFWNNNTVCA